MRDLREDEVLKNGEICCKRCGGVRQRRLTLWGTEQIVECLCDCEAEQRDREEAEAKRRARMIEIRQLRANGLQDASLARCTFANDRGYQPESAKLRAYVEQFPAMRKRGAGLLLWGDVGTVGQVHGGDQGVPVLMTGTAKLLNAVAGVWPSERNAFLESLNAYALLILDDLGMERSSEFSMEQMFSVVDGRYRTGKPLIVTTNLTLQELKNPPDLAHARIYDRLLEMCTPLRINGQSIRQLRAQENMRQMRERLTSVAQF